ncbi:MAG: ABC transporter substrate-binding protein [Myxococcales bacterium]|nr:ABC transporter substrate-binding protein [Myxococcales bacterium]MCB9628360.1 ABC transporter substrate-binding protein [Sandaracinaceae bacterium]
MSRTRTTLLNTLALLLALGACLAIATSQRGVAVATRGPSEDAREVRDADGTAVPVRPYRRIASLSPIADAILLETIPADRLVGLSGTMREALGDHRFSGIRSIDGASVEQVLALDPDLVIVSGMADAGHVRQLRDAGVPVFRLGEMRGLASFAEDARDVGTLVGAAEAGVELAATLSRRMRAVAADVPLAGRPRGLYLGVIGRGLYGGANGTSYHDVLLAAGLEDALEHMDSWPELTPEQVLELDPDVVLLHPGTGASLCQRDGLAALRACRRAPGTHLVEVQSGLLNDPGLGMLPCAERVRAAVHGAPRPPPSAPEEPSPHE